MKRLDTSPLSKMPTSIETWQFLSDAVRDLSMICRIAGAGVYKLQDSFNDGGYVVWAGELLQINGGSGSYIRKVEKTSGIEYEGEKHDYYKEVVAERCGNTSGAVLQSNVSSINTTSALAEILNNHTANKKNPHGVTKEQVGLGEIPNAITDSYNEADSQTVASAKAVKSLFDDLTKEIAKLSVVPKGTICMWSGTTAPEGWALCDGKTIIGTGSVIYGGVEYPHSIYVPNLQGRFIVGYNTKDPDYITIGKVGGLGKNYLTVDQLPAHTHTVRTGGDDHADSNTNDYLHGQNPDNRTGTYTTSSTGKGAAVENRPPYYVLAYIIKL